MSSVSLQLTQLMKYKTGVFEDILPTSVFPELFRLSAMILYPYERILNLHYAILASRDICPRIEIYGIQ